MSDILGQIIADRITFRNAIAKTIALGCKAEALNAQYLDIFVFVSIY
jgi:hypothetical protein